MFKFPPGHRIKRRGDFLRIQSSGRKAGSPHFLLISSASQEQEQGLMPSRLGITVTKKVHKRAVRRNKLKRILREIFRQHSALFKKRCDIVIVCRKGSTELSFSQIEEEITLLFGKARLLSQTKLKQ